MVNLPYFNIRCLFLCHVFATGPKTARVGCNSIVDLARMVDATQQMVGWGGVIASLTWHAWSMLRNRWGGGVDACAALLRFQILFWYALECFICIS